MTRARSPLLLYGSFAAVYLVWGSSFAATKLMVQSLPPYLAGGMRFALAGVLLLIVAWFSGARLPRKRIEWRHIAVMALFHAVFSAGINIVAMEHVASNQAALLNASGALWITLLGAVGRNRHPLTARVAGGVAFGFIGVGTLLWPRGGFTFAHFGWQLVILCACLSWALGTHYFRGIRSSTPTLMFFALEMFVGGVLLGAVGLGSGEAVRWQPQVAGLVALAYLAVFNSCLTYTAYGYLMYHTTPARLSTYAYVNPLIAALVGWWLLGEAMSSLQLAGMAVILVGVVLVSLPDGSTPVRDRAPAEPTG